MKQLKKGTYFGLHKKTIQFPNLLITDTEYTHDFVDWHYHENAYFTFLLAGQLREINKKERYQLTQGSLVFHQWQDPHYNIKEAGYAQGFHVEINPEWFKANNVRLDNLQGSMQLSNPLLITIFNQLYRESKIQDDVSEIAIQGLVLQALATMQRQVNAKNAAKPNWVEIITQLIHEESYESLSLTSLAKQANLHPVYLSREFPRYFQCTLGNYMRARRLEKAIQLLLKKNLSMMLIANQCGFADESHFVRSFKQAKGVTPAMYRKQIVGG